MKKFAVILIILISTSIYSQQKEVRSYANNFSPEQQATLKTKSMTLDLDLDVTQQNQILALNKKYAELRKSNQTKMQADKTAGKQLTSEEKFKLQNERLDHQIAYSNELKKILNQKQFDKWQENRDCKMQNNCDRHRTGEGRGQKSGKGEKSGKSEK
jgi:protein CpxP